MRFLLQLAQAPREQNIPLTRIADNWETVARSVAGRDEKLADRARY